jgi:tetratricopeptide (TPR) repeat protein
MEKYWPPRWKVAQADRAWERFLETGEGEAELLQSLDAAPCPRTWAWRAQYHIFKVLEAYKQHGPYAEAGVPAEARAQLQEAEAWITQALDEKASYAALTIRGHIRVQLGKNSEAQKDFQAAGRLTEAKGIEASRRLMKKALQQIQHGDWLRARHSLVKAAKGLRLERQPGLFLRSVRSLERAEDTLRLLGKTQLVSMGQARVSLCKVTLSLLISTDQSYRKAVDRHLLDLEQSRILRDAWNDVVLRFDGALAEEMERQGSGGSFARRLGEMRQELSEARKR